MNRVLVGMLFSLAVATAPAAQMKYGVTATSDKNVDFTKFKSYSWSVGQPNPTKSINAQIIAAVDRELKALGLTKAEPGPGDVLVSYYAFRRTDVGMKPKSDTGAPAQTAVGTLSVVMLDPKSKKELLRMRLDKPIDTDPAQAEAVINTAVAELFEKYPTRKN